MAAHSIRIPIGNKDFVSGFLHSPTSPAAADGQITAKAGAILVSGAGGGVYGPTGIWMSLATRLAQSGVPTIRLDYRQPNVTPSCVVDIRAAIDTLGKQFKIQRVGLVGWSYGSAPIFTLASHMLTRQKEMAANANAQMAQQQQQQQQNQQQQEVQLGACAVVAPQTADAYGIRDCPSVRVPVLLVHGTNDQCLSPECSKRLKAAYESADKEKQGKCEVLLLEGDDHCLTHKYALAEQHILDFLLDALLLGGDQHDPIDHTLVPSAKTGLDWMQRGHDLATAPATGERESVNEPTRNKMAAT